MKKKSIAQSAFFNPRVLVGIGCCLAGFFLAFAGLGQNESPSSWRPAPVAFDAPGPHAVPPPGGSPKIATEPQAPDTPLAPWTGLANPFPSGFTEHCMQLTDGTVMCHEYGTNRWHRLKPDINGSYQNGSWDVPGFTVANMPNGNDPTIGCVNCPYTPLFFASAVLADGRVVVIGGEYNGGGPVWTNIGFLYNPVANTWSAQLTVPATFIGTGGAGTGGIGDAQCIVLQNGTMLLACTANMDIASFNPATLTFTALAPTGKDDLNDQENWNILPNGKVLTVDSRIQQRSETYNSATNAWEAAVDTIVNLADTGTNTNSKEVGPAVMRPDGTIIYFSGTNSGQNAVYNTATGTWAATGAAGDFPLVPGQTYHYAVADGPASLLPNGNVLVMASPVTNVPRPCPGGFPPNPPCYVFNIPSHFYEFDGTNLTQVADSPNAASFISYQGRFLVLPTGEVLLTAYNQAATADVQLYSNGGAPQNAWRPVITAGPAFMAGTTYTISGKLFNGFSEGASYGDDAAMSTNYPLVRIKNQATGHVFYARTHDHSRMGVEPVGSNEIVTTLFDVPAGLEAGPGDLVVVANGIASDPTTFPPPIPGPTPIIHVRSNPTPRVREGGTAYFMVEADRVLVNPVTVTYALSGNATLNSDYTLTPTPLLPPFQVTIPAGQVRTPVRLDAYQDGMRERRGESATMTIQPGMGYAVYNGRHPPFKMATIKILD
jgi:hypothetical protein